MPIFFFIILPNTNGNDLYPLRLLITVSFVTVVWIIVTLVTSKNEPTTHLVNFYKNMRIAGPGWKRIGKMAGIMQEKSELKYSFYGWLCCILFIYSTTLGIGKLVFQKFLPAILCLVISLISGIMLYKMLKKMKIFISD